MEPECQAANPLCKSLHLRAQAAVLKREAEVLRVQPMGQFFEGGGHEKIQEGTGCRLGRVRRFS